MRWPLLLLIGLSACKPSKEDVCDAYVKIGNQAGRALTRMSGTEASPTDQAELRDVVQTFHQQCMSWPDEVFECMRSDKPDASPCRELISLHVYGVTPVDIATMPAGPAVVATAELGEPAEHITSTVVPLVLRDDGTLAVLTAKQLAVYNADGAQRWQVPLAHTGWLVEHGELLLLGDPERKAVVAYTWSGELAWTAAVPVNDADGETPRAEAALSTPDGVLVALADGRFVRVDPAACAAKKPKTPCVSPAFTMANETFDRPILAALDGDLLVREDDLVRRLSLTGEVQWAIQARDYIEGVSLGGTRMALAMDDELVLLDPSHCTGARAIALPRKRGRMYVRGEGDCPECRLPPSGCLIARAPLDEVRSAPTILESGEVITASPWSGPARVTGDGRKLWNAEISTVGDARVIGDDVVFLSDNDGTAALAALTLTGKAAWTTPLGKVRIDSLDSQLWTRGAWIVAQTEQRLHWLKIR